jgi:hypothetical protein
VCCVRARRWTSCRLTPPSSARRARSRAPTARRSRPPRARRTSSSSSWRWTRRRSPNASTGRRVCGGGGVGVGGWVWVWGRRRGVRAGVCPPWQQLRPLSTGAARAGRQGGLLWGGGVRAATLPARGAPRRAALTRRLHTPAAT